jgi:protein N-terminal methyltransferase
VDLVEPSKRLLDKAREALQKASASVPAHHRPGTFYCEGLQTFQPEPQRYHCIWVQWCLLYLTDDDVVGFLRRCRKGIQSGGVVFVKENVCANGFVVDREDSSLTRSNAYFLGLFARADMSVTYNVKQRGMPDGLFQVRMWVLRPKT